MAEAKDFEDKFVYADLVRALEVYVSEAKLQEAININEGGLAEQIEYLEEWQDLDDLLDRLEEEGVPVREAWNAKEE